MQITQTRRRFLTTASMAGVVGLVDAPAVLAEEGSLETTAVRLEKLHRATLSRRRVAARGRL